MMTPELSVIVAVVSDVSHLRGCLSALLGQQNAPLTEIIVPYDAKDRSVPALQEEFPQVQFYRVDHLKSVADNNGMSREHHDELRAKGLQFGKGGVVALVEDHGRVQPDWSRKIIETHAHSNAAAVGGAIENEVDTALNWAVYFCDFGRYQNPLVDGPSFFASDANISYKRAALETIRDVWQESFNETTVNGALLSRGATIRLSPAIVLSQHRLNLTLRRAMLERYVWGRSYAGTRAKNMSAVGRWIYAALSPAILLLLVGRKIRDILHKQRHIADFIRAFPLIVLLTSVWSFGELIGYLTGRPSADKKE